MQIVHPLLCVTSNDQLSLLAYDNQLEGCIGKKMALKDKDFERVNFMAIRLF